MEEQPKAISGQQAMEAAAAADAAADQILNSAFADISGAPAAPQPPTPVATDQPPQDEGQPRVLSGAETTKEQLDTLFSDVKPDAQGQPSGGDIQIPQDQEVRDPENMDERAVNAWAFLKRQKAELRRVAEQQKAQIEQMRAEQAKAAEERKQLGEALAAKERELQEKTNKLGQLGLSNQSEFRRRYDEPLKQAEADLDALISAELVADTPEEIAAAREKILADDDTFRHYIAGLQDAELEGRFLKMRQRYLDVNSARSEALKQWQATQAGLEAAAADENAAEALLQRTQLAEKAIAFNTQSLPVDRRAYVLTDPFFASDVEKATEAFKGFMQTATPEQIARSAFMGFLGPSMNRALVKALQAAQDYQREYYKIAGLAKPGTFVAPAAVPRPPAAPSPAAQPRNPMSEAEKLDAEADQIAKQFLG